VLVSAQPFIDSQVFKTLILRSPIDLTRSDVATDLCFYPEKALNRATRLRSAVIKHRLGTLTLIQLSMDYV